MPASPLEKLRIADPKVAGHVVDKLNRLGLDLGPAAAALLADTVIDALTINTDFGFLVADGMIGLAGRTGNPRMAAYAETIEHAGRIGATYGILMASHLPPVLLADDPALATRFKDVVDILHAKGVYAMKTPLERLTRLLHDNEVAAAKAFLELLSITFSRDLSYNRCSRLARSLPNAVAGFSARHRVWQTRVLIRTVTADERLIEPFLNGMAAGLALLAEDALGRFIDYGLEKYCVHPKSGAAFLSLESQLGQDWFSQLQVTVALDQVRSQLDDYVKARTGMAIGVKPISTLGRGLDTAAASPPWVCSDGAFIYLPDEISRYDNPAKNKFLYKLLAKIESGFYEFGSFGFDMEKLIAIRPDAGHVPQRPADEPEAATDIDGFYRLFPLPLLAADLLNIFEHGRIRRQFVSNYPGLAEKGYAYLGDECRSLSANGADRHPLFRLYKEIALGMPVVHDGHLTPATIAVIDRVALRFAETISIDSTINDCGGLVWRFYSEVAELFKECDPASAFAAVYTSMETPFGLRLRPELYARTLGGIERLAGRIRSILNRHGIRVFQSDLKEHLYRRNESLTAEDVRELAERRGAMPEKVAPAVQLDPAMVQISTLTSTTAAGASAPGAAAGSVFHYAEWDYRMADYLLDHVRVRDRRITSSSNDFYGRTLRRYPELTGHIRHAFEMLRPEKLVILRRWMEGDEFDYRALLDFAVDRKSGRTPSERIYVKRLKQTRDLAVLLLVDLSRSTANAVPGTRTSVTTVMDVQKEAIVLFCEALDVVGDAFAVAGFSGSGRSGVDYYRIKDFQESLNDGVKDRIKALAPQRSTRMGAAIRHAGSVLQKVPARVRLLIIIGDGFPNDEGYKRTYAIEDTRRAISEMRAGHVQTKALTVNMGADPRLDDLYGNVHHYVINDVRDLPDRLVRMYGRITRA
ncbi:MAG: hypothetical protein HKM93_23140 [Desulfobacteraceae bacterium]|nr:hypothetical protein [Desulfobacteraceae bacterium]